MRYIISLLFLMLLFSFSLKAQDKKLRSLYNQEKYCKCIKRFDKISSKKKSAYDLYFRAASYYNLHVFQDKECEVKNPLIKAITAFVRLQKHKGVSGVSEVNTLKKNIIETSMQEFDNFIEGKNPEKALTIIDQLMEIEQKPLFYMAKAYAEYHTMQILPTYNAYFAIRTQLKTGNNEEEAFVHITRKLLLFLDSTRNKNFQPLMDTVLTYFPNNDILVNAIYDIWKNDMLMHKENGDYKHLLSTINVIFKHFPHKEAWKNEVVYVVVNIADSLVDSYNNDNSKIDEIFNCCNFLTKVRHSLPEDVKEVLQKTKYFSLKPYDIPIRMSSLSSTANVENEIVLLINSSMRVKIVFDAVIPKEEIMKARDFIWEDAPLKNRAKNAGDILKKESINVYLLDSLCMFYCNEFRKENGMVPLEKHPDIYRTSRHHSSTMAALGAIFHGEDNLLIYGHPDSVAMYKAYSSAGKFSCTGENVLYNFSPSNNFTYDKVAQSIINQWIGSPAHRANMLNPLFKYGATATCIAFYYGHHVVFHDEKLLMKYYPELHKLLQIFPSIINVIKTKKAVCFATQNFACP